MTIKKDIEQLEQELLEVENYISDPSGRFEDLLVRWGIKTIPEPDEDNY